MTTNVSRRSFLVGAAALGVAAMISLRTVPASFADEATDDCDILVIGGGISAALAALSAMSAGAGSVILVEKQSFLGGSARLSSGFMVTVNNDHFDAAIDDSWEKMSSVLHGVHDQSPDTTYPNWDRLEALFAEQSATIDYMADDLGMAAEYGEKSTAVTMWDGKGAGMMDALEAAMRERGVDIRLDSPATEVLVDEAGAVCGATVEGPEGAYQIAAKKVILACGGAAQNPELFSEWVPTCTGVDFDMLANAGNVGDGFTFGKDLGLAFYDTMVYEGGGFSVDRTWKNESGIKFSNKDKLLVNAEGIRFTNEAPSGSGSSQMLTYYMVEDGSPAFYFVVDAAALDDETKAMYEKGVEMGCVWYAEDIDALATAVATPALPQSFEVYQASCEARVDEEFGKAAENLVAYDGSAGLYAVLVRPSVWGTIGGIVTDWDFHCLDEAGAVVPNLFAVGEMSNREFFSCFYVGGNSLALSSTMGRLAGATAVAEL